MLLYRLITVVKIPKKAPNFNITSQVLEKKQSNLSRLVRSHLFLIQVIYCPWLHCCSLNTLCVGPDLQRTDSKPRMVSIFSNTENGWLITSYTESCILIYMPMHLKIYHLQFCPNYESGLKILINLQSHAQVTDRLVSIPGYPFLHFKPGNGETNSYESNWAQIQKGFLTTQLGGDARTSKPRLQRCCAQNKATASSGETRQARKTPASLLPSELPLPKAVAVPLERYAVALRPAPAPVKDFALIVARHAP